MVEHLTFNQVVRGSNPRTLTKKGIRMLVPFDIIYMDYADVAELADALDLGSSGRPCRFKSCHPHESLILTVFRGMGLFFFPGK